MEPDSAAAVCDTWTPTTLESTTELPVELTPENARSEKLFAVVLLLVTSTMATEAFVTPMPESEPYTFRRELGVVVPMPTLPVDVMNMVEVACAAPESSPTRKFPLASADDNLPLNLFQSVDERYPSWDVLATWMPRAPPEPTWVKEPVSGEVAFSVDVAVPYAEPAPVAE